MSKEVLKELVVSEEDLLGEAVVKAKGLLAIEDRTGNVILRVPRSSLTARDMVGLHLIGRYFASQMGKVKSSSMSLSELANAINLEPNAISPRLSEMVGSGWVSRVGRAEFAANPYLVSSLLDEIVSSHGKLLKAPESYALASTPQAGDSQPEAYPDIGKLDNLTDAIVQLLGTPWGKNGRDWKEIREALKHNAMLFSVGSVTGTLTQLIQSRKVRRSKEGRAYRYLPA